MVLWFAGTSVVTVWLVFRDPRFDYRLLIVGALLPDVVDAIGGGAGVFHSVTGSVMLLVVVMVTTVGNRARRKRWLALPIGTFLHLAFDGAFANTELFWWPFSGTALGEESVPVIERGAAGLALEAVGLALCWWAVRRFCLTQRGRRARFWRTGELAPC